jgi:ABC-type proline/glycine betaine transport system ATPase subunit
MNIHSQTNMCIRNSRLLFSIELVINTSSDIDITNIDITNIDIIRLRRKLGWNKKRSNGIKNNKILKSPIGKVNLK